MVSGKFRRRRAVGEARAVVHVRGSVIVPRQSVLPADVQGVALIVVQQAEAVAERKIGKAAIDVAESQSQLIRVGEIKLRAIFDTRGTQRQFPAVDTRALNGYGNEQLRILEIIVVEEICGQGLKVVGIDGPAVEGNGYAELVFFVTLAMQWNEAQVLVGGELQQRAGDGLQWRRLIKVAVESAENPS